MPSCGQGLSPTGLWAGPFSTDGCVQAPTMATICIKRPRSAMPRNATIVCAMPEAPPTVATEPKMRSPRIIGLKLVGRHTDRTGQAGFRVDARLDFARDRLGRPVGIADIEKGLVEAGRLQPGRKALQYPHHLFGDDGVGGEVDGEESSLRTAAGGLPQRHPGMNAVAPGFIGCRRDDSPGIGIALATDDDRLAT